MAAIHRGEVLVRTNALDGTASVYSVGTVLALPGIHQVRRYSTRDQVYRPVESGSATGTAPFQSVEGLSLGIDLAVRWTVDPSRLAQMSKEFPDDLFEPTLNSTNPVNNYPQLLKTLNDNNGIITDVDPDSTMRDGALLAEVLKKRGIFIRTDLEKSMLIEYAGLVRLAREGVFKKGESILLLGCGRGKDESSNLLPPDAIIDTKTTDPVKLFDQLQGII